MKVNIETWWFHKITRRLGSDVLEWKSMWSIKWDEKEGEEMYLQ